MGLSQPVLSDEACAVLEGIVAILGYPEMEHSTRISGMNSTVVT